MGSPHITKQFYDSSCVSYHSTQFGHYLPEDGTGFCRLRARGCKIAPTPDTNCDLRLVLVLLTDWVEIRGSHDEFVRVSHSTQETSLLIRLLVITKNIKGYESTAG